MSDHRARPHLPGRAMIDAYGNGGFRFADMSHRGSLLCLPSGLYAWPPLSFSEIVEDSLAPIIAERGNQLKFLLLGSGARLEPLSERLRFAFHGSGIHVDVMATGSAARTYNIMLGEGRPVGAALLAVA